MKSDRLEDFIKENREAFDYLEPSGRVWENIRIATRKTSQIRINTLFFRAAAVLLAALLIPALILTFSKLAPSDQNALTNDPELKDLLEAEAYYAHQVTGKLREIRKCYNTFPEIKNDVEADLNELEDMYLELKKDLRENVSKKMVIEAMIDNNRTRLKIVDEVLEQIDC